MACYTCLLQKIMIQHHANRHLGAASEREAKESSFVPIFWRGTLAGEWGRIDRCWINGLHALTLDDIRLARFSGKLVKPRTVTTPT
jgi:hypothetical protein